MRQVALLKQLLSYFHSVALDVGEELTHQDSVGLGLVTLRLYLGKLELEECLDFTQ